MHSNLLKKARLTEDKKRKEVFPQLPRFHVTGGCGWINDPNGFAPYKGEYHLFFQYYPYDKHWGPMHWGHVKTIDFFHWKFLPAALAPDQEYDRDGCFSGGAVEMPDGRHLLLYTGVRKDQLDDGSMRVEQTQCVAIGDGLDYQKLPENPVIGAPLLPPGNSTWDFRDPKVWCEGDTFYAVAANRNQSGRGEVLLYQSHDGIHWHLAGIPASCTEENGPMWECPDLFPLDGKHVLMHSALAMQASGLEFHPGNGTVCHIGRFNRQTCAFTEEAIQTVDYGLDFYAPQTLLSLDNRRIMIAWMQNWDSSVYPPENLQFIGQMTFPRELRLSGTRLCQWPVREIEACRQNPVIRSDVPIQDEQSLPEVSGRVLDLSLQIRPGEEALYQSFTIKFASAKGMYTELTCYPEKGTIRIDRSHSGFPRDIAHVREFPVSFREGEIDLRLLLDKWSFELFVNGGEQAASATLYTPLTADGITFSSDRQIYLSVEKYDLIF